MSLLPKLGETTEIHACGTWEVTDAQSTAGPKVEPHSHGSASSFPFSLPLPKSSQPASAPAAHFSSEHAQITASARQPTLLLNQGPCPGRQARGVRNVQANGLMMGTLCGNQEALSPSSTLRLP